MKEILFCIVSTCVFMLSYTGCFDENKLLFADDRLNAFSVKFILQQEIARDALPAAMQLRLVEEQIIATIRGNKLFDAIFFDKTRKTDCLRKLIGLSDEQVKQFDITLDRMSEQRANEMSFANHIPWNRLEHWDSFSQNEQSKILEDFAKLAQIMDCVANEAMNAVLSEKQLREAKEYFLASPSSINFSTKQNIELFYFIFFDVLSISNDQKKKMLDAVDTCEPLLRDAFHKILVLSSQQGDSREISKQIARVHRCLKTCKTESIAELSTEQRVKLNTTINRTNRKLARMCQTYR